MTASASATLAGPASVRADAQEIVGLTTLRGLGALVVVLYHVGLVMPETGILDLPFFHKARPWIDIFFVLSGFVLCHVHGPEFLSGGPRAGVYRDFLVKRLARVYPLHLSMLGAMLAIWIAWYAAGWHPTLPVPSFTGLLEDLPWRHILRHLTMTQAWWTDFALTLNIPSWSISMEWAIYLLFPLIMAAAGALTRRSMVPALVAGLAALYLVSLIREPGHGVLTNIYGLPRTIVAFTFGVCVRLTLWQPASAADRVLARLVRHDATVVASFALLGLGMTFAWHDVVLVGLVVLFTCAVGLNQGRVARLSAVPVFYALGVVSYSTYLVHWPLLIALAPALRRFVVSGPSLPALWAAAALCILLSHAAAFATYRWIEVPGRRWVRRRFLARRAA